MSDGSGLLVRHWQAGQTPWARIEIVHGLAEHSGRWEHVGESLAAAGLEAAAADLRGFGESAGPRADIDRWDRFHDDLGERLAVRRAAAPPLPVVFYGHSLGALTVLGYALSDRPRPELLVLSAPAVDDDLAAWKHRSAPVMARLAPRLRIPNGVTIDQLAAAPRPGMIYEEDPLVIRSTTARFGALAFAEQARVRQALARLDALPIPTLVLRGADDPVVPARAFDALARLGGVTARTYPEMRHEIHNERGGGGVLADVVAWIAASLGREAATAGTDPDATAGTDPDAAAGTEPHAV
jgi:acylglycerol lipase